MKGKMVQAFEKAGVTNYMPTTHAIDRAKARFGIDAEHVADWLNAMMEDATLIGRNDSGYLTYKSHDVRIVVNEDTNTVITVHHDVKTDFLRPALERELRKLKRHYTKVIRQLELKYAEALRDMGDMAINRAKARNPQTRELIAERLADKQRQADEFATEIERLTSEWKSKVRAIELISE